MIPSDTTRLRPHETHLPLGFLTVLLGSLQAIMPLSTDLYLPALPTVARDLGTSPGAVQLTLAIFMAGVAVGQLIYGPITDRYGRKMPLTAGLVVYVLGALLCALAPSLGALLAGRLLQALGAASSAVITAAIVRDLWSGKALAGRLSSLMLVIGVVPLLAPSLGSVILQWWDWHGLFWCLVAFGGLAVTAVTLLPETSSAAERALTHWRDAPGHYLRLLRTAPFMLSVLSSASMGGVLFSYLSASPFVYIQTLQLASGTFAILFAVNALGFILSAPLNRVLLRRSSMQTIARRAILTAAATSLVLVAMFALGLATVWTLTPLYVLLLGSVGLTVPNAAALAFGHVRERMGSASAVQGSLQVSCSAVAGALVASLGNGSPVPMAGITLAFAALAVTFIQLARRHDTPAVPAD